jgi:hypothetical protein
MVNRKKFLNVASCGLGKAQPLSAKIITPTGWTTFKDVRVGDDVCNTYGGWSKVTGVYDRGVLPMYEVEFSDGSKTKCCKEHLWNVQDWSMRARNVYPKTLSLGQLLDKGISFMSGWKRNRFFIPMCAPVMFLGEEALPVAPYVMGALLGDGVLSRHNRVAFTGIDKQIINRISRELPQGYSFSTDGGINYFVSRNGNKRRKRSLPNAFVGTMHSLGLMGKTSHTKFIPRPYMLAKKSDRIDLLHGLMDTDGYISKDGHIDYYSVSTQLINDVADLVRSLGGTAKIRNKVSTCKGKKFKSYRLSIRLPEGIKPCYLRRKLVRYRPTKYFASRAIVKVTYCGNMRAKCIAVSSHDNCYLTDDFIVTHNTVMAIAAAEKLFELHLADKNIIISLATLKEQWCNKLDEFSSRHYTLIDGTPKQVAAQWEEARQKRNKYVVLNYETVVAKTPKPKKEDIKTLLKVSLEDRMAQVEEAAKNTHRKISPLWDLLELVGYERSIITADESTKIKSRGSKTAKRIKTLSARWMWCLSATPLENSPDDLFSIMEFLNPNILGSYYTYKSNFCITDYFGSVVGYKNLPKLHSLLKPHFMRVTTEEVKDQLPEMLTKDYLVDLDDASSLYNFVKADLLSDLEGLPDSREIKEDLEDAGMSSIMQKYSVLRQICQSPQILKDSKNEYAQYLIKQGMVKDQIGGKLHEVVERVKAVLREGPTNKIVLFNFYKGFLALVAGELYANKIGFTKYTGDETKEKRRDAEYKFSNDTRCRVMLCTDAGGVGLDLPVGNYIYNTDLPFNPAKLRQRNRIQRISSRHKVNTMLTVTCRGSVESRIYTQLLRKEKLKETIIDGKHLKDSESISFVMNKKTLWESLTGETVS